MKRMKHKNLNLILVVTLVIGFVVLNPWPSFGDGCKISIANNGRQFIFTPAGQTRGYPVFLCGISYFYSPGIGGPQMALDTKKTKISKDLLDFSEKGFNVVRIMVNCDYRYHPDWCGDGNYCNSSIVKFKSGTAVKNNENSEWDVFMYLVEFASNNDIIVDVTAQVGTEPALPHNYGELFSQWMFIAEALKEYENVYFDVSNENNNAHAFDGDYNKLGELADRIREKTPACKERRLLTCSWSDANNQIPQNHINGMLFAGKMDFISAHFSRDEWNQNIYGATLTLYSQTDGSGLKPGPVPILYQEPFKYTYKSNPGHWPYSEQDFYRDHNCAKLAGAAGWFFHNEHYLHDIGSVFYTRFYDTLRIVEEIVFNNIVDNPWIFKCSIKK